MVSAKYALVTGGNRGIGLEVCKQLVAKGKPVLLTCRNAAQGGQLVDAVCMQPMHLKHVLARLWCTEGAC